MDTNSLSLLMNCLRILNNYKEWTYGKNWMIAEKVIRTTYMWYL